MMAYFKKKCFGFFNRIIPARIYVSIQYYKHFKKLPNLNNPSTFNEKLQWLKLYDHKPIYTVMVDKYRVKKYVSNIIGKQYIIPTFGVWKHADDIDFDSLPDKYVLKWTHDSGSILICKDKSSLDKEAVINRFNKYEKHNGYWYAREWAYKNIKPVIIAEKYIESDDSLMGLTDYKFYCFNGEPKFLYVSRGLGENHKNAEITFLNTDWTPTGFKRSDFKEWDSIPPKPKNLDLMIELSKKLSKDVPFLRVDLYEVQGKVLFSELTFCPCGGLMKFTPPEDDKRVGRMLRLPSRKKLRFSI